MGKTLSTQQVRHMIDYLHDTIDLADHTIIRPDATLHEVAVAVKIKTAATSYIGLLSSIPDSDLNLWFPVIKSVAMEITKYFLEE